MVNEVELLKDIKHLQDVFLGRLGHLSIFKESMVETSVNMF